LRVQLDTFSFPLHLPSIDLPAAGESPVDADVAMKVGWSLWLAAGDALMETSVPAPKVRSCFELASDLRDVAALKARARKFVLRRHAAAVRFSCTHADTATLRGEGGAREPPAC
jgi:hypothetical protein